MNNIKHIYWFAPYDLTCPSTRYRGKLPLDYFAKHKQISHDFISPQRTLFGLFSFLWLCLKILFFRKKNSLIVVQKICSNRFYANIIKLLIRIRNQNTLYDIDDAEYYRQETVSLHYFLSHCRAVQVGSEALQKYCLKYNPKVYIATSPVCFHKNRKAKRNPKLELGWVGDFGNGKAISKAFAHKTSLLKILFPALKQLNIPIKLVLIGIKNKQDIPIVKQYFKDYPHVELEMPTGLDWTNDSWLYAKIAQFDIGLSPMVLHPFNEAKSAFKAKQYLSCGVPTIASNTGENHKFVHHGKNGFIANSPLEFKKYIVQIALMSDQEYQKYANYAANHCESFSMKTYCNILIQNNTLEEIVFA